MKPPLVASGRRFNSIFNRIILLHLVAVAVTSALILGAAYFLFDSIFRQFEYSALQQRETAIAASLRKIPTGWRLDLPSGSESLYTQRGGGFSYAIVTGRGGLLFASNPLARPLLPPGRASDRASYVHPSRQNTFVAASFPETRGGETVWVQVAQDLGNPDQITDDVMRAVLNTLAWVAPGVLLLLLIADTVIIRRALRPAVAASRIAEQIHPDRIDLRLPTDSLPAEILPLALAVNRALDRLESGFRMQREFTADAAHELRTPLTVIRLRIEELCPPATATALKADVDVMARIVGQLLAIAELETLKLDLNGRADLCAVAERVASYLAPMAVRQDKEVAFTSPGGPVWVRGDEELLFQALRNLAENAIAHTAAGTAVEIAVDAEGAVRTLDRGPGVPQADRLQLFQRFWRRNRRTSGGAGLGLSIVARIAEAHGGEVAVADRSGGGAVFTLTLQSASAEEKRSARSVGETERV